MSAQSALASTIGVPVAPTPFVGRRAELARLREEWERPGPGATPPGPRVLLVAGRPGSGRTSLALRLAEQLTTGFALSAHLSLSAPFPARRLLDALGLPRPTALAAEDAETAAEAALREHFASEPVLLVLDDVTDAAQVRALLPQSPGSLVVAVAAGPLSAIHDVRPCVLGGLDYTSARELLAALAGDIRVVVDPVAAQALSEAVACHAGALRLLGGWLAARPRASVTDALRALREIPADVFPDPGPPPSGAGAAPSRVDAPTDGQGPSAGRRGWGQGAVGTGADGRTPDAAGFPRGQGSEPGDPPDSSAEPGRPARGRSAPTGADRTASDAAGLARGQGSEPGHPPGTSAGGQAASRRVGGGRNPGAADPGAPAEPTRSAWRWGGPRRAGAGASGDAGSARETVPESTRPESTAPAPPKAPDRGMPVLGLPGQAVPPMPTYPPGAAGADRKASGPATAPPPPPRGAQRSDDPLRRAFALVYGGLGASAQLLLRLATVVPGGVLDARGAAALVGSPIEAAGALLGSLAAQQLLRDEGDGHYRLPESLRPVLTRLREAEDKPALVELAEARWLERQVRLLGACLVRLAPEQAPTDGEVPPVPLRFRSAAEAWAWLDSALPTLLPAVDAGVARGGLDGLMTRLATVMVRALPVWGEGRGRSVAVEQYALHSAVQELARRSGQPRRQAAALVNLGDLHAAAGEHARAMERYRGALAPARAAQDHVAVGRILEATAGAYRASGDLVRAVDFYGRALTLRRNRGERADEARLLGRLAATHSAQGRYQDALREYRAAVALYRKLSDEAGAVGAILGAARVQELSGGTEAALRTQREALEAARRVGGRLEGLVLLRMADALERAGDPAGARLQRTQATTLGAPTPPPPAQPPAPQPPAPRRDPEPP
ncbi:tetratricopeptide (TPR) repeat protein [Streptacidiphilus sp. MAP12-20]|uniref:tetratricopeptide repeat protein n=1 Tax=Streptacidiphilus sp. MAP12-20 TaxID=3156299 RepID=UPI0035145270